MINIPPNAKIACLCEGSSEKTIINLLLEEEQLIFNRNQLLDEEPLLNYMNSKKFTDDYLNFEFEEKIIIFIIGDRDRWKKIGFPYNNKISEVYFFLTTPEIEMLMVHALNIYTEYCKYRGKVTKNKDKQPSVFLAQHLKQKTAEIKNKNYIENFFSKHSLVKAIKTYSSKTTRKSNCYHLNDLLN